MRILQEIVGQGAPGQETLARRREKSFPRRCCAGSRQERATCPHLLRGGRATSTRSRGAERLSEMGRLFCSPIDAVKISRRVQILGARQRVRERRRRGLERSCSWEEKIIFSSVYESVLSSVSPCSFCEFLDTFCCLLLLSP